MSTTTLSLFADNQSGFNIPEPWACDNCHSLQHGSQDPNISVMLRQERGKHYGWDNADGGQFCSYNCMYTYVNYEDEVAPTPKYKDEFPALAKSTFKPAVLDVKSISSKYPTFGEFVALTGPKTTKTAPSWGSGEVTKTWADEME